MAEALTDRSNCRIYRLRRPGRGGRALRLAARVFLRLLTKEPLRPFSLLACFLTSCGQGRGRCALRRAATVFLRLLTRPPLRPFSKLARRLASLRTNPPSLPRAAA